MISCDEELTATKWSIIIVITVYLSLWWFYFVDIMLPKNSFLSNLEIQDFFSQVIFLISSNFSFSVFDKFRRRYDDKSFGPCFWLNRDR